MCKHLTRCLVAFSIVLPYGYKPVAVIALNTVGQYKPNYLKSLPWFMMSISINHVPDFPIFAQFTPNIHTQGEMKKEQKRTFKNSWVLLTVNTWAVIPLSNSSSYKIKHIDRRNSLFPEWLSALFRNNSCVVLQEWK